MGFGAGTLGAGGTLSGTTKNTAPVAPTAAPVMGSGGAGMTGAGKVSAPPDPNDPLSIIWNLIQSAAGPAVAGSQLTQTNLNDQLGAVLANQTNQSGLINQAGQLDLAKLGIQGEQLGIQRGQLGRAQQRSPLEEALAQRGFGVSQADIDASRQQAQFNAGEQQRGLTSASVARGANVTQGYRDDQSAINKQLGFTMGGLGRQEQRLGIQKEQHALGYGEEQAQLKDASKNLDLVAKGMGIDKQQIENRTQNALNQLGLSTVLSTGDIYGAIIQAQAGQFSPITQLLPMIYGLSGVSVPGGS